jgi:hypothetical protein
MIPLILRKPSGKNLEYLILADSVNKENLVETQIFKDAIASDKGIAIIDLWGSGETSEFSEGKLPSYHTLSRTVLWLGRSILGEWVKDYTFTASFFKKHFNAEQITLAGTKEAGLASLFCAVLSAEQLPVILEQSPVSFVFNNQKAHNSTKDFFSMALHLPGIINWGDVQLATSLTGADVRFIAPVLSDGTCLDTAEQIKNWKWVK